MFCNQKEDEEDPQRHMKDNVSSSEQHDCLAGFRFAVVGISSNIILPQRNNTDDAAANYEDGRKEEGDEKEKMVGYLVEVVLCLNVQDIVQIPRAHGVHIIVVVQFTPEQRKSSKTGLEQKVDQHGN